MGLFANLQRWFGSKPKGSLPRIDLKRRFELLNRTGQGSMSKVWRARDRSLYRTVCIKLLDKEKKLAGPADIAVRKMSDGSWLRTLLGRRYHFDYPVAVAVGGGVTAPPQPARFGVQPVRRSGAAHQVGQHRQARGPVVGAPVTEDEQ